MLLKRIVIVEYKYINLKMSTMSVLAASLKGVVYDRWQNIIPKKLKPSKTILLMAFSSFFLYALFWGFSQCEMAIIFYNVHVNKQLKLNFRETSMHNRASEPGLHANSFFLISHQTWASSIFLTMWRNSLIFSSLILLHSTKDKLRHFHLYLLILSLFGRANIIFK